MKERKTRYEKVNHYRTDDENTATTPHIYVDLHRNVTSKTRNNAQIKKSIETKNKLQLTVGANDCDPRTLP